MEDATRNDQGHDSDSWINVGEENQNSGHENFTEAAAVAENEEDNADDEDSEDDFAPAQSVSTCSMFAREKVTNERKANHSLC